MKINNSYTQNMDTTLSEKTIQTRLPTGFHFYKARRLTKLTTHCLGIRTYLDKLMWDLFCFKIQEYKPHLSPPPKKITIVITSEGKMGKVEAGTGGIQNSFKDTPMFYF